MARGAADLARQMVRLLLLWWIEEHQVVYTFDKAQCIFVKQCSPLERCSYIDNTVVVIIPKRLLKGAGHKHTAFPPTLSLP